MAKRKAPSPGSESDRENIYVRPQRSVRRKLSHAESPAPSKGCRKLHCVLIPKRERLAAISVNAQRNGPSLPATEDSPQPIYERPLIIDGKRSRRPNVQKSMVSDFSSPAPPLAEQTVRADHRQPTSTKISHSETTACLSHAETLTTAPSASRTTQKQAGADTESEESGYGASRDTSQRPRRSIVRQSYVPEVMEDNSEDELALPAPISRKSQNTKAVNDESDFEDEDSLGEDDEVRTEQDSESEVEESDSDDAGSDEGYGSGIKSRGKKVENNGKPTSKASKASAMRGTSKTGKQTGKSTAKDMLKLLGRSTGEPKGLNMDLPPLSSIDEIFKDIISKALSLGLREALKTNPRPLRVATMCSGTESPLLALEMVQDSLKTLGAPELKVEHLFSAEIVPYKQAYIERNFHPPIIFRDITEITSAASETIPTATTVYGSKVAIPGNVHVLIAGTSCVDS